MKYFLILFCSLLTISSLNAQDFITDDKVETTAMVADDEMKVLYFTASWCGPCKRMKPGIEKMAADPNALATIYKMDIDTNITDDVLNVSSVPTFLFLKNGTLIGQHRGAMSDADLNALFKKHSVLKATNTKLEYKPKVSRYAIPEGSHPKLNKKNISKLWYSDQNLTKLAWSIHNNLDKSKDLKAGVVLVDRSYEINPNSGSLYLKSSFLNKLGNKKEALETADAARKMMLANGEYTGLIDNLIKEIGG